MELLYVGDHRFCNKLFKRRSVPITIFKAGTIGNKLDERAFYAQLTFHGPPLEIRLTKTISKYSILGDYNLQYNNC
jgi:hypothetical protein